MPAKQTGPQGAVKALSRGGIRAIAAALALAALSACASTSEWSNPNKTAAEAKADEQTCSNEAQENAVLRSGHSRVDYGMPPPAPGPGGPSLTPMQMKEQDKAANNFHKDVADCMESKGYAHGKAGPS